MTFIAGDGVELRVLQESEEEARIWTDHVMHSNDHMKFVMTGSTPMRWFDVREEWMREREKGAVIFGVWLGGGDPQFRKRDDGIVEAVSCDEKFIGTCGVYSPYEIYRSYDTRFMIVDPDAIGKGVGLKVAKMLNEYAFMKLNAHRLGLGVSALNLRAIKTYLDAGYQFEGVLKDSIYTAGEFHDTYRMAITREGWEKWRNGLAK